LISLGLNLHWQQDGAPQPHEANQLMLSSAKAKSKLGWHPRWNLTKALDQSLSWHQAWLDGDDMNRVSRTQITEYIPDQSNEKAN
jgi:CDP-glucose 4,6-dehydratase